MAQAHSAQEKMPSKILSYTSISQIMMMMCGVVNKFKCQLEILR